MIKRKISGVPLDKKIIFPLIIFLFLVFIVFLTRYIIKTNQDYRSSAVGVSPRPTIFYGNEITINSLADLTNVVKNYKPGQVFSVKISKSAYRAAYIAGFKAYIARTGSTDFGEPIDVNFVGYNKITGTVAYGPPFEKVIITYDYYHYVGTRNRGEVLVKVTNAMRGSTKLSKTWQSTIEGTANMVMNILWNNYIKFIEPTFIYNDSAFLHLTFRVR